MSREEMKAVVERLHTIWNTGDLALVPEVYAADFVVHWLSGLPPRDSHGREGAIAAIEGTRAAFPDWYEDVVDMVIGDDRVVTRYVSTGTHEGEWEGIAPTDRKIEIHEMSIYRIENDLVAEQWCVDNELSLMGQITS